MCRPCVVLNKHRTLRKYILYKKEPFISSFICGAHRKPACVNVCREGVGRCTFVSLFTVVPDAVWMKREHSAVSHLTHRKRTWASETVTLTRRHGDEDLGARPRLDSLTPLRSITRRSIHVSVKPLPTTAGSMSIFFKQSDLKRKYIFQPSDWPKKINLTGKKHIHIAGFGLRVWG